MFYSFIRIISIITFRILFRLKVRGEANIPLKTNFIVAANHQSFFDPFILSAAIPRKIHWITLRHFFRLSFINWFLIRLHALPSGKSSEKASNFLAQNQNVGIFPEGTRTFDGTLKEFRRGAALLAMKTGRPILPCTIIGAYKAFPRMQKFPRLHPIEVRIGKPIYLLKEFEDEIDDINLQQGILRLRNEIKEMLNEPVKQG